MIPPSRMSKVTAIALATGAIAAPAASAYPPRVSPSQSSLPATQLASPSRPVAYIPRASGQPTGAVKTSPSREPGEPLYARQDKQLVPRSAPLPALNPVPAAIAPVSNPTGGFNWGDAGIGASGSLMLSVVAVGGGLALVQRRARRTGTSVVATR